MEIKKRRKTRMISVLLALCMALALLPGTARAEEDVPEEPIPMEAPRDVTYDEETNILSWSLPEGAHTDNMFLISVWDNLDYLATREWLSYSATVEPTGGVYSYECEVPYELLVVKKYTFSVQQLPAEIEGAYFPSDRAYYSPPRPAYANMPVLPTPTDVNYSDGVLSWTADFTGRPEPEEDPYERTFKLVFMVVATGEPYKTYYLSLDPGTEFSLCIFKDRNIRRMPTGTYDVTITAVADPYEWGLRDSEPSATCRFEYVTPNILPDPGPRDVAWVEDGFPTTITWSYDPAYLPYVKAFGVHLYVGVTSYPGEVNNSPYDNPLLIEPSADGIYRVDEFLPAVQGAGEGRYEFTVFAISNTEEWEDSDAVGSKPYRYILPAEPEVPVEPVTPVVPEVPVEPVALLSPTGVTYDKTTGVLSWSLPEGGAHTYGAFRISLYGYNNREVKLYEKSIDNLEPVDGVYSYSCPLPEDLRDGIYHFEVWHVMKSYRHGYDSSSTESAHFSVGAGVDVLAQPTPSDVSVSDGVLSWTAAFTGGPDPEKDQSPRQCLIEFEPVLPSGRDYMEFVDCVSGVNSFNIPQELVEMSSGTYDVKITALAEPYEDTTIDSKPSDPYRFTYTAPWVQLPKISNPAWVEDSFPAMTWDYDAERWDDLDGFFVVPAVSTTGKDDGFRFKRFYGYVDSYNRVDGFFVKLSPEGIYRIDNLRAAIQAQGEGWYVFQVWAIKESSPWMDGGSSSFFDMEPYHYVPADDPNDNPPDNPPNDTPDDPAPPPVTDPETPEAPSAPRDPSDDANRAPRPSSGTPSAPDANTVTNPDGSKTTTMPDGTVTTTATDAAGNKTTTTENPNGSTVTTIENKDGGTSTTTVSASGQVTAAVTAPAAAVAAAQAGGQAVALPMPRVPLTADAAAAPVVTVTTDSGRPVKVEIPVERTTPGTVAVIVRADGTEEVVKTSLATANGVTVTVPDGATVKIVDNSRSFADAAAHWAGDAITFAAAHELFNGTGADTFTPNGTMTRGMMVTVLARYDGVDTAGGATWYEKGVDWAAANGISNGADLNAPVSREQLATMLYRYAAALGLDTAAGGSLNGFPDAGSVSGYAVDAMAWAVGAGLIGGTGRGELNPGGSATRAEVATILMRFCEKVVK